MSDFFTQVKKSLFDIGGNNPSSKSSDPNGRSLEIPNEMNRVDEELKENHSDNSIDLNENEDFQGANVDTNQSEKKIGEIQSNTIGTMGQRAKRIASPGAQMESSNTKAYNSPRLVQPMSMMHGSMHDKPSTRQTEIVPKGDRLKTIGPCQDQPSAQ
jgi:hypothetical protein